LILSLDLALTHTGWALLSTEAHLLDHGLVVPPRLPRVHTLRDRAEREWRLFWAFLRLPWKGVSHVVYETPKKWMRASETTTDGVIAGLYSAETILHLACVARSDVELHAVDPNDWQEGMLTNIPVAKAKGRTKEASIARARLETGLELAEHEADAVCLGIWWVRKREWEMLGGRQGTS